MFSYRDALMIGIHVQSVRRNAWPADQYIWWNKERARFQKLRAEGDKDWLPTDEDKRAKDWVML